ncbi:GGDEF domain-containing protein [Xanthomonas maliensis]|uniref:GGDEF domain-containing protein n=1 Tax=Xanthomonas maliensis TaxID=1321368 RepID=UPI00039AB4B3|nr:GGDEF domain-containing protein [Xanthomonas maliensis]
MRLYAGLSRVFPRSFSAKLLAVTFVGIHLPLLLLIAWLAAHRELGGRPMWSVVIVALAATLAGTVLTLSALYRLLSPLRVAADALDAYYADQRLPSLPEPGDDELGRLLRGINRSLRGIDAGMRDLRKHALLDPLTEALNRRGCEQAMRDSVASAQREGWPFVLFVLDLDNLKPINDRFGHLAGDRVLVRLVESAFAWLGAQDWIGRWGGDEFLIGVHASEEDATLKLNQWLSLLECEDGVEAPLHVSAGCAVYTDGLEATELYRRADAAMYRAKFSGGRRLVRDGHENARGHPLH